MVETIKNAGAKAGKPKNAEENKIFAGEAGGDKGEREITNTGSVQGDNVEMTQIPTTAFQEILDRLNTLERKEGAVAREEESDIFDPLAVHKGLGNARVGYLYNPETGENDLVLSYIPRVMANGQEKLTWVVKDKNTSELRDFCSVICMNSKGEKYERKEIDYVNDFLIGIDTKEYPIKQRIDIGKQVKQDFTIQRLWNGRQLAPTNVKVQNGYMEQKFNFIIHVEGKDITFSQSVINIK